MGKTTPTLSRKRKPAVPKKSPGRAKRANQRTTKQKKDEPSPGLKKVTLGLASLKKAVPLVRDEGNEALSKALASKITAIERALGEARGEVVLKPRPRRTSQDIEALQRQVTHFLRANPDSGISEIAAGLEVSTSEVRGPVAGMLKSNRISKRGDHSRTVYSLSRRSRA